jgi:hypothetical protein
MRFVRFRAFVNASGTDDVRKRSIVITSTKVDPDPSTRWHLIYDGTTRRLVVPVYNCW